MKTNQFVVFIEQDEDGVYIGSIPNIHGCHAQGDTQEKMLQNLQEVLKLCYRNMKRESTHLTKFVGIQNLEFSYA